MFSHIVMFADCASRTAQLNALVEDLQAKNERLERQIAKMG